MALSNQSEFPEFFSPRKVNLKIGLVLEDDLPRMVKSRKIILTVNGQIPEDDFLRKAHFPENDLPKMAKSRKMTYPDWPHPGLRQAGISKEDLTKPNQQP